MQCLKPVKVLLDELLELHPLVLCVVWAHLVWLLELHGDELGVLLDEVLEPSEGVVVQDELLQHPLVLCVVWAHLVRLLELALALCVVWTHHVRLLELPGDELGVLLDELLKL